MFNRLLDFRRLFAPAERNVWFDVLIRQLHRAPLERQTFLGREVYKHLAPPEPEHRLIELFRDCGGASHWRRHGEICRYRHVLHCQFN